MSWSEKKLSIPENVAQNIQHGSENEIKASVNLVSTVGILLFMSIFL